MCHEAICPPHAGKIENKKDVSNVLNSKCREKNNLFTKNRQVGRRLRAVDPAPGSGGVARRRGRGPCSGGVFGRRVRRRVPAACSGAEPR